MASIGGDDIIGPENGEIRRTTRSGRTVAATPPTPTRTTRRSTRKKSADIEQIEEQVDFVQAVANLTNITEEVPELSDELIDNNSAVQSAHPTDQAYLVEEMSGPEELNDSSNLPSDIQEDKSSSFPFGTLQSDLTALYDQSSTGGLNDAAANTTDSIETLLANLTEDNANSLPSDGGSFSQQIAYEPNEATSENSSLPAFAEDLANGNSSSDTKNDALEAEMVSEDELPAPAVSKIDDAEEVSDEELPGPKLAELPADTEVVSEDELPASIKAKRGYDPASPTDGDDPETKKARLDDADESANKEEQTADADDEKKNPTELDKYWKAVNDDPTDFTAWTYLLQYVDQENQIETAREAYDAFLAHYPYCYGYWRKYGDYEKRKGNKKKCEEVFERGLKAISLSADLWIHYLIHVKSSHANDTEYIRTQFERAIDSCGLEFRSDKLWEAYIKWETENKDLRRVIGIYDRLLSTPTLGYNGHFDSFQEIINNNPIQSLISVEEFKKLRSEVRANQTEPAESDLAPGEDEADDHVCNDAEATAIKDKVLATRRKLHKNTINAVTDRWAYEEGIKRPYFHVKALERCQLKNWKEYLDFEIEKGDHKRVLVLFERCLIACALYDEFWTKYIRYLESKPDEPDIVQKIRDVFERACTIHHPDKPSLHLQWSTYEEVQDNKNKAADILTTLDKTCPNLVQIAYRRINLERRRGDLDKCAQLYEHYIAATKSKNISSSFAIKYARFCHKIRGDLEAGLNVLRMALVKDSNNARLALQLVDLVLQRTTVDEGEVIKILDDFINKDSLEADQKVLFTQRKVEFLEDFGSSAKELQEAQRQLQSTLAKANEAKKKTCENSSKKSSSSSSKDGSQSQANSQYNSSYYGQGNNSNYYGNNQYNSAYGDGYNYSQWQQYGAAYSGYGQWNASTSGYGSSGYY